MEARPTMAITHVLLIICCSCTCLLNVVQASSEDVEITLDGSQYLEKSLIVQPTHQQTNELSIIFKTSISSGVLFYASGLNGDYIVLELIHGKIRYTANSDGLSKQSTSVEIIYGKNYADGRYHQVNVKIGEFTKLYTYTYPEGQSNQTVARSNAKDLRYDLDEMSYYGGLPLTKRANTRDLLYSKSNFRGCLNVITFNKKALDLSEDALNSKSSLLTFHGAYNKGCQLAVPKFLKSFSKPSDKLEVYSHVNRNMFKTEFYYRTYLQTGNVMVSRSPSKLSSMSLSLQDNQMSLTVNLTRNSSIKILHFDDNADNGVWRKIRVEITPTKILFTVDKTTTEHVFNKTQTLHFPYKIIFGGEHSSKPGLVGCIKDVYLGNDLTPVNKIMNLNPDTTYEETQCAMKDFCLPSKPCLNKGRCIQTPSKAVCNCKGTGYTGQFCKQKDTKQNYKKSCTEYFKLGYRDSGIYIIKPGSSSPFKIHCEMTNPSGPKTVIKKAVLKNETFVFNSKSYDKDYYYHQISYSATKQQIADLVAVSQTCRQYLRYDCIASSLLNSYKTERSSNLGVRWYSRKGFARKYWHGDMKTSKEQSCRCGLEGNCASPDVLCNCDVRDQKFRFDDGYVSEKEDLPISKLRVSIQRTNHRSSFRIGDLECSDSVNITNDVIPSFTPEIVTDKNGVILHDPTTPYSNHTDIKESGKKAKNFILIDSKLLYGIIIGVVLLISMLLLILILKRRLCCWYYGNKAKPQIVEIYKHGELMGRNNNKNGFNLSNDVTLNVDDVMVSLKRGMSTAYPASCSDSSVSTIDPSRYYQHENGDSDTMSLQSSIIGPKRSILKIKKDLGHHQSSKRHSDGSQNCSSGSESNVARNNNKLPPQDLVYGNKSYVGNRDFINNDGDNNKTSGLSPLKQKILEMSTSRQGLHSGELYFHHQDSTGSTLKSTSSCSSSKESDINTDGEVDSTNDMSVLLPLSKCERSKSVRFSDDQKHAFYSRMYRNGGALSGTGGGAGSATVESKNNPPRHTLSEYEDIRDDFGFGDEALV